MAPKIATTNVGSGGGGAGGFPQYAGHVYENASAISIAYDVPVGSMFRAKRFTVLNIAGATKLTLRQGDTTNGLVDVAVYDITGLTSVVFSSQLDESINTDDNLNMRNPIKAAEFYADESIELALDAGTADLVIDGDLFTL